MQIVDARNPLGFRCEDLEEYVREIEGEMAEEGDEPVPSTSGKRKNLLLVNKADLLTKKQRSAITAFPSFEMLADVRRQTNMGRLL